MLVGDFLVPGRKKSYEQILTNTSANNEPLFAHCPHLNVADQTHTSTTCHLDRFVEITLQLASHPRMHQAAVHDSHTSGELSC